MALKPPLAGTPGGWKPRPGPMAGWSGGLHPSDMRSSEPIGFMGGLCKPRSGAGRPRPSTLGAAGPAPCQVSRASSLAGEVGEGGPSPIPSVTGGPARTASTALQRPRPRPLDALPPLCKPVHAGREDHRGGHAAPHNRVMSGAGMISCAGRRALRRRRTRSTQTGRREGGMRNTVIRACSRSVPPAAPGPEGGGQVRPRLLGWRNSMLSAPRPAQFGCLRIAGRHVPPILAGRHQLMTSSTHATRPPAHPWREGGVCRRGYPGRDQRSTTPGLGAVRCHLPAFSRIGPCSICSSK